MTFSLPSLHLCISTDKPNHKVGFFTYSHERQNGASVAFSNNGSMLEPPRGSFKEYYTWAPLREILM